MAKVQKCAYCADKGWMIEHWQKYQWCVSGRSSMFIDEQPVYQCPYCHKPKGAPEPPKEMFSRKSAK